MSDLAILTHSEPHAVSDRSQFARLSGWTVITLLAAVVVVAVVVAASRCHPPASSRLSPPAPPRWLSSVTKQQLEDIYAVTYKYIPKQRRRGAGTNSAALALRTKLMGGDNPELWEQMKWLFASLFMDTIPNVPENVPPLLYHLFSFVACSRREGLNIFGNGAGKSFVKELFSLRLPSPYISLCANIDDTNTPN
jgi:hypothetical protein